MRRQSAATAAGLLQAPHQIAPDPLDHRPAGRRESRKSPAAAAPAHALIPCRINSQSAKLICRAAALDTAQLFLLLSAFARSRFNALT